jgi:hypothetical protein
MVLSGNVDVTRFKSLMTQQNRVDKAESRKKGASQMPKKRKFTQLHPEDLSNPDGAKRAFFGAFDR